ncbi:MAG: inositol monophosphatase family protein [Candidatus Komeilibacteria bacterium]
MTRHQLAKQLAKKAGDKLLKDFKNFKRSETAFKKNHEAVTKYDKQAEKIILDGIKRYFPNDAILSEEAGANNKKSEYLWAIDPLDGTHNFVMNVPVFSVSIGLFHSKDMKTKNMNIKEATIYWPRMGNMYTASLGKGSFINGKKINVSKLTKTKDAQIVYCYGKLKSHKMKAARYYSELVSRQIGARQIGSSAIELSLLASGYVDSMIVPGANMWDVAAGVLIVREAGGKVTDADGKEWRYGSKDMAASNGLIHKRVLKIFNDA